MNPPEKNNVKLTLLKRAATCAAVIAAGIALMGAMANMKKLPEEKKVPKQTLSVEILNAEKKNIRMMLSAFGEVASLNTVDISPEVSGVIINIHPRLEEGEIIAKEEVLFTIDPSDYMTERKTYAKRRKIIKRSMVLAENEYRRVKKLYDTHHTGTLSDVETAEQSWNTAQDSFAQIEKLYRDAERNLERCTVKAPFDARIKSAAIEKGQFVSKGTPLLSIADDSLLEMTVPVDSAKALTALDFEAPPETTESTSWFGRIKSSRCQVIWEESGKTITATGYLHRVVKYDSKTRTIYLAVRINAKENGETDNRKLPIVDGMFCRVNIPGRILKDVIAVPDHAVSYDGKVRIASDGRLKTVPVQVVWKEDGYSLISSGLETGESIITTRLSSPLENTRLEISEPVMVADGLRRQ